MSSEPPEEPQRRSEPSTLSPASPKPIHFPAPTHIPVLEMQMDVGFNQTEAHMNDPAMHNTEIRPGSWQDAAGQPDAQQQQPKDIAQVDGTADDTETMMQEDVSSADAPGEEEEQGEDSLLHQQENGDRPSNEAPAVGSSAQSSLTVSHPLTVDDNAPHEISNAAQAHPDADTPMLPSSTPTAQQPPVDSILPQQDAAHGAVDVRSMLATLQDPSQAATDINTNTSTAPVPDGLTLATTVSPSSSSAQTPVPAPGVTSSPLSASNLGLPPSGLPPRPPPQEQPLIHPDYVHSQHIRDYHPHAAHSAHQPHVQNGTAAATTDATSRAAGQVAQSPSSTATSPQLPNVSNVLPFTGSETTEANGAAPTTSIATTTQQPVDGSAPVDPQAGGAGLAPPQPQPQQQMSQTSTPVENSRRESAMASGEYRKPEDRPWNADTQRKYDQFLEDERRYVNEGRWEQFPRDSRLFIGNLSSERVTKRDIFHVFHIYGDLAQISIKQAFGFVQFLRAEDCAKALEMEQGTPIRDKKINLEVSKPQNNRNKPARARSRSPDHHGHTRGKGGSNVDRYVSSQRNSGGGGGGSGSGGARGGGGGDGNFRGRNYRSPSPRGYRDRYDDRRRKRSYSRSRSRSPRYGRSGGDRGGGGGGGGRYRSPSPRRNMDDDLPLPRRDPGNVPDVQIIVLDQLDRDFVAWVEGAFASRGIRVDSLLLSSRLSEQAVVRRQIVEGVLAVSKLTRSNQAASKIGLQIFDRRAGANNVSFEEYDNLDPSICAELVLRAKAAHPPPTSSYGGGGGQQYPPAPFQQQQQQQPYNMYGSAQQQQPQFYGHQQQQGYPPHHQQQQQQFPPQPSSYYQAQPPQQQQQNRPITQSVPPNLQHLITNLDSAGLQNLLSAMNPQSGGTTATTVTAHSPFPPTGSTSASASAFLRPPLAQQPPPGVQQLQHQQQQQGHQQGQQGQQHSTATSPTSAGAGPGQQVNMQEILARLATYK